MIEFETVQSPIPPGMIDLGLGDPQLALLPLDIIRQAAGERLAGDERSFLQYGTEQGDGRFRLALARFLSDAYDSPVDPARLLVTCGVSFGLDLVCSLFTRPGDTIFVEEPSYFLALRIFADHGLKIVSLPTDADGLVIEALEAGLAREQPKFLYVIPVFQNPTGRTLSQARRQRLADLSRERGLLVVADEVYHFLSYGAPPPRALGTFAETGNVISLGSFSKILAPGLRLGWLQADAEKIRRIAACGLLDSGGGLNPFTSVIAGNILESGGLVQNIARLTGIYRARSRAMGAALRKHLPGAEFVTPQGGYFFWVRVPGVDTAALQPRAMDLQVNFRPGVRFSSRGGLQEYLRLSYVYYEPVEIEEGLVRLKQCLEREQP
jgi:DNA-binding transcriptional MocR family regulator